MDGLAEFEESLAAEKAERERSEPDREERRHRKHKPRHHHRSGDEDGDRRSHRHRDLDERGGDRDRERERHSNHHHRRHRDEEDGGHRHKRSRHSRDGGGADDSQGSRSHKSSRDDRHREISHAKQHLHNSNEEQLSAHDSLNRPQGLKRDAWMAAPAAFEVEHIHRPTQSKPKLPTPEPPKREIHSRELNSRHLENLNNGEPLYSMDHPPERSFDYTFGDAGSAWRMTKLKAVYTEAEESGRSVEEVALNRFGSLEFFDDAREEKKEMDKRKIYGEDVKSKDTPSGELYRDRMKQNALAEVPTAELQAEIVSQGAVESAPVQIDQTTLNRLRAQMMKAKLRRAPDAAKLEEEYNRTAALAATYLNKPDDVVLSVLQSRQLAGTRGEVKDVDTKRGRERGQVEENTNVTIEQMIQEERRTKGQAGGEGMRLAERIAKDGKFDDNLDYMDENAEKLAKRVHKSEVNLKNMAINEFQKLNRIIENCPLCHKEDKGLPPIAPVVSLATRVFLTLPTEPEVSDGGAVIVPTTHRSNLLECDDDEWEEIRNFMKSLTRLYHDQGREVIFYENAAAPQRHLHAAMMAVPIPYEEGATAPAFFKEAFLSSDEEWSQHRKIIDTDAKARDGMGRMAFRRCIAKEMPYFHVWFTLDGGLGHVVENSDRWPKGDLFAREIIGGIVDAEPHTIKKQGRWSKGDVRVDGFKRTWRNFDWTRVLTET